MSSNTRTKIRRAHTKSRNGCTRCKSQRKKCDEIWPRCTRCAELDIDCQYPKARQQVEARSTKEVGSSSDLSPDQETSSISDYPDQAILVPRISTTPTDRLLLESSQPTLQHSLSIREQGQRYTALQFSINELNARDLDLFSHYLTHTSRSIPFDKDDSYALQVGFPNLAFSNKPLMSSILALAAACQCHDLLMNHYPQGDTLDEIQELLSVAEQHHTMSLQYLQDAIPEAARYDCILASAALMMLYGSASHCVRIRLFEMHKVQQSDTPMPSQFVPAHSQWISLIRAVHLAYIGIVADRAKNPTGAADDGQGLGNQSPHVVGPEAVIGAVSPPEDGPTHDTRQLFLPIVAATSGSAMEKLRAKACRLMETAGGNPGLQACWEALVVLETTVARTFAHHDTLSINTKAEAEDSLLPDTIPLWMRAYIARVTSNSGCSSSPLRRTINAFLNRVPASYVQLVQEMLNLIPLEGDRWDENQEKLQRQTLGFVNPDNYVASRLAVEILAHWLVLVLLLDGVWWIGETGSWELGRVVAFVRGSGWLEETVDQESEDAWWPRSMYEIRIHLRKLGI